jgi:hypothetical protein
MNLVSPIRNIRHKKSGCRFFDLRNAAPISDKLRRVRHDFLTTANDGRTS